MGKGKRIKFPYEYDPEARRKAKVYSKIKLYHWIADKLIMLVVLGLLLASGVSASLRDLAAISGVWHIDIALFIFAIITIILLARLPLSFYSDFTYEHKYGLSNQGVKGWLIDFLKAAFLNYLFAIPVMAGLYFLMASTASWWLYAGLLSFLVYLAMDALFPVLILPFFYKTEPFRGQEQKQRLLDMVKRAGARNIKNIIVAKESEKSKKANAMFAGFWKTKRIVLFDTLLDSFTPDEIETVVAHELGHYVNKDVWRFLLIEIALAFATFYLADMALKAAVGMFGIKSFLDVAGLPLLLLCFELVGMVAMPLVNSYSRFREAKADYFALEVSRKPIAQISTEKRLADMALAEDDPAAIDEFLFHSHPAPKKRIVMAREWMKKRQ
ncbi:MAG: M48 family metallopeptidase [Candidatus Aenigmarchaeota archaeon]|nr:M48 family metallopeptidase [Candidatus Aenigmarchaeota archaeon]